jgi:hypothetical protein
MRAWQSTPKFAHLWSEFLLSKWGSSEGQKSPGGKVRKFTRENLDSGKGYIAWAQA